MSARPERLVTVPGSGRWLNRYSSSRAPRLRLICIPYAGGSAGFCSGWAEDLPAWVDLLSVQLPGRGERLQEPPITEMAVLIEKLATMTMPFANMPYVIFGHSMGAMIGYELVQALRRKGVRQPEILMASGTEPP